MNWNGFFSICANIKLTTGPKSSFSHFCFPFFHLNFTLSHSLCACVSLLVYLKWKHPWALCVFVCMCCPSQVKRTGNIFECDRKRLSQRVCMAKKSRRATSIFKNVQHDVTMFSVHFSLSQLCRIGVFFLFFVLRAPGFGSSNQRDNTFKVILII